MLRIIPLLLVGVSSLASAQGAPRLNHLATIGCGDCGGPAQFAEVADVALAPNGTVWVADRDDPRIRVFTRRGEFLRSFGRRGQGPGEYTGIEKLFPAADGTVAVVDMRQFRLTRVDSLGAPLSIVPLLQFPFDAAAAPGSRSIHLLFSRFEPGTSVVRRVEATDSLRTVLGPLVAFPTAQAPAEVHSLAVAPDGAIAVGDGSTEYRIRVYRGGRWNDLTRDIGQTLRTPDEILELESRVLAGGGRARAGAEGGQAAERLPREKPWFDWLALRYDAAGRLWVRTGRGNQEKTVFDVWSPGQAYLGETVVPGKVTAFFPGEGYLATVAEDADGVPAVTVWAVR